MTGILDKAAIWSMTGVAYFAGGVIMLLNIKAIFGYLVQSQSAKSGISL